MNPMKELARTVIRRVTARAPWGIREAMLEGYMDRVGVEGLSTRLLHRLKIVEIAANGDCGVMASGCNDQVVLLEYAANGTFAPTVVRAVLDFFADGPGTYMDVGANIGLTTIPIARNGKIRCLAFEPEPMNFGHLKRNCARNADGAAIKSHQVALFNSHSTMSLSLSDDNMGDHRLTQQAVSDRRTVQVAAVPLDDYLDRIAGKLAVKVDTQGAEPFVVAGGRKVLARAGLLAMEFCPYLMRRMGGDPSVVVDLAATFDRVAIMRAGAAEAPQYVDPTEARSVLEHKLRTAAESDGDYLDILAIRGTASPNGPVRG